MSHRKFWTRQRTWCSAALGGLLLAAVPTSITMASTTPPADGGSAETPCPPAGDYDTEGEFAFTYTTDTRSFDPDRLSSAAEIVYLFPVYDTLIYQGPKGELEPLLAEAWTVSEDGSAITLVLRSGLTFHDGSPIDAEAVKANLDRSRTLDGGFNVGALSTVSEVVVVSPTEVELQLDGSPVGVLASLGGAAGMMKSPASFELDHLEMARTGGSGAFRLDTVESGVRTTYTRVDDYWDTGNSWGMGTIRIEVIGDTNARLNALLTGQVGAGLAGAQINEQAIEAGLNYCRAALVSANVISLNTARSEFADPLVREALALAIDREGLGEVVFGGDCVANSQRFPAWFYAGSPDIPADLFTYDLDRARELLEEAGVGEFSFDLHTPADVGTYMSVAEVVQQSLAEIGITMNIVPSELHTILEDFRSGNADAHIAPLVTTEPASYLASFYLADGINNPGGYEAEGMAELFESLAAATSTEEQAPIFAEIAQLATDEIAPFVPICNTIGGFLVGDGVGGMQIYFNNSRNFRTVTAD